MALSDSEFAELYEQYFEELWQFAYRYVRASDIAEEVVHDVFLNIWRTRGTWAVRTTVRAYLYGAVRNRALTQAAQSDVQQFFDDEEDTSTVTGPDRELEESELQDLIHRSVEALPERQKLVMTLRLTQEMTYLEIASVLGVTEAAVGKLMLKAQARLKAALGRYFDDSTHGGGGG